MNRFTKPLVLTTTALAVLAGTFELASARDRYPYWRHHRGHHVNGTAIAAGVIGLAAGAIIVDSLARPEPVYRQRRIYREAPVIVDEDPAYADPDVAYGEPEAVLEGEVDADRPPRIAADDQAYDERLPNDQAADEDYFPDRPQSADPRRHVADNNGSIEPWSRKWRNWCSDRYQSFNPETGTYRGYDGRDHFCTAG